MKQHEHDFDSHIGFWIKGMSYLWVPGESDVKQSKRIYTLIIPSNVAIFDKYNNAIDHNYVENDSKTINDAYWILPLGGIDCDFVRNCFLVDVGLLPDKKYTTRIEGKIPSDYYKENESNEKIPVFGSSITIIDSSSGFNDSRALYIHTLKVSHLIPDFLPMKVVYNKDSHFITQKITHDRRKNVSTKEILRAFYKKNILEETWSTNKTVNTKHYAWFTQYTSVFQHPSYIDIGCGSGKDASIISKEIHADSAVCADVKDSRVPDAKAIKSLDFTMLHISEPLNIEDNSINVITLFHTIHHMEDAEYRLKDIHRVLTGGGLLIIKDHNVETQTDADNVTFEHFVYSIGEGEATVDDEDTYKDILPMYYYSAYTIATFLERIGFEKVYLHTYTNPTRTYNAVFKKPFVFSF